MSFSESNKAPARQPCIYRWAFIPLSVVALFFGSWLAWNWYVIREGERRRAEWKRPALEQLATMTEANENIRAQLNDLKAGPTPNIDFRWAHEQVALMTNGEFIVYAFRHGHNDGSLAHLFLGRGSDGRWLYSSYHFCGGMAGAVFDDPPGSIAEFMQRYSVREFDGKSDQCLEKTWPVKK